MNIPLLIFFPRGGWNWPHLSLLLALPAYAWLAGRLGWQADLILTLGTLAGLAWLMLWERLRPARPDWQASAGELARDLGALGVNALVDAAAGLLTTGAALHWQAARAQPGLAQDLTPVLALPLAVMLGELGPYWLHRAAHRLPWLWRFHALHHWPAALNASNSVLVHPVNLLWNKFARVAPWLLLGFSAEAMLWAALFIQLQSLAVHANLRGSLGPLNWLIGSAELHRWHHSVQAVEAHNYGTALPLWDQLFGSFVHRPGALPARVGWLAGAVRPRRAPWLGCC